MDPAAFLEAMTARGVAQQDAVRAQLAARVAARAAAKSAADGAEVVPLVIEPACEVDGGVPDGCARVYRAAVAAGWTTRLLTATAIHPERGRIESVTVRAARPGERCWAAWWRVSTPAPDAALAYWSAGARKAPAWSFEHGWLLGPLGIEALGMVAGKRRTMIDALEGRGRQGRLE